MTRLCFLLPLLMVCDATWFVLCRDVRARQFTTGAIYSSPSGTGSWTERANSTTFTLSVEDAVSLPSGRLVAAGKRPGLAASDDSGATWTTVTGVFEEANGLAASPGLLVAVGANLTLPSLSTSAIAVSDDEGRTWSYVASNLFVTGQSVAYCDCADRVKWVAVGNGTRVDTLAFSRDGKAWTGVGLVLGKEGNDVVFGNRRNRWVAVGERSAYSDDGMTWNVIDDLSTHYIESVAYSSVSGRYVVVGSAFLWSDDGTPGTFVQFVVSRSGDNYYGRGVAFGAGLWMIAGQNTGSPGVIPIFVDLATTESVFTSADDSLTYTSHGAICEHAGTGALYVAANLGDPPNSCGDFRSCTCSYSKCTSSISLDTGSTFKVTPLSTFHAENANITLSATATMIVDVTSSQPTTPLATADGIATVGGTLVLVVPANLASGNLTVLQSQQISGTFSNVVISSASNSSCISVRANAPIYTTTAITVTFTSVDTCAVPNGLSTGAIIGIAVGAAVVACALFVLAIVVAAKALIQSDAAKNRELRGADLEDIKQRSTR